MGGLRDGNPGAVEPSTGAHTLDAPIDVMAITKRSI